MQEIVNFHFTKFSIMYRHVFGQIEIIRLTMEQTTVAQLQLHKHTNGGSDLCVTSVCVCVCMFAFLVSPHSKGSSGSLRNELSCICVCIWGSPR